MKIRRTHREVSVANNTINILDEFRKGINLEIKFLDVKRLFLSGFGSRVLKMGYDPDDVLQEIYKGLLIRNRGRCSWDQGKSSFGSYVHMVAGCIISNYTRKSERIKSREVIGMRRSNGDDCDVAEIVSGGVTYQVNSDILDISNWVIEREGLDEETKEDLIRIVPLLIEGWTKREIAKKMDLNRRDLDVLIGVLKGIYEACSVN